VARVGKRTHLRFVYFLPSWQGGDVETTLCLRRTWGRPDAWPAGIVVHTTNVAERVDCPNCRRRLAAFAARARLEADPPPPRRPAPPALPESDFVRIARRLGFACGSPVGASPAPIFTEGRG
jgi:hypothetical protein